MIKKLNLLIISRSLFLASIFAYTTSVIAAGGHTTYELMELEQEKQPTEAERKRKEAQRNAKIQERMYEIEDQKELKEFIKKYPEVTTLIITDKEEIINIFPISRLHHLILLVLSNCNNIRNIEPIKNLRKLEEVDLYGCTKLSDISPLAGLIRLKKLDLSETSVESLTPLYKLVNLKELNLTDCKRLPQKEIDKLQYKLPHLKIITEGESGSGLSSGQVGSFFE